MMTSVPKSEASPFRENALTRLISAPFTSILKVLVSASEIISTRLEPSVDIRTHPFKVLSIIIHQYCAKR
nr:MAG TPA: hypothetical protein [Caudoviricetes sp.]